MCALDAIGPTVARSTATILREFVKTPTAVRVTIRVGALHGLNRVPACQARVPARRAVALRAAAQGPMSGQRVVVRPS
jgi:hypothetical protein